MKSLARMSCYWPKMDADIRKFCAECLQCGSKPQSHSNLSPWPLSIRPMQRVHIDYCGPFLQSHYVLVVIDSFSKFPEVFLTKSATSTFTKQVLQKVFAREDVAQTIVSDNGTHFTSDYLRSWLKTVECTIVYTPPRHPQSNGLAENFIRTYKIAIRAANPQNFEELDRATDTFLLQYLNSKHGTTNHTPAFIYKERNLRSSLNFDTTEIYFKRGNDLRLRRGIILGSLGSRMFNILDIEDSSIHRRHYDQLIFIRHENPPLETSISSSANSISSASKILQNFSQSNDASISPFIPTQTSTPFKLSTADFRTNSSHLPIKNLQSSHTSSSDSNQLPDLPARPKRCVRPPDCLRYYR